MADAWVDNQVFKQNSNLLYWWTQVTYYLFHPLTLFVIATGLFVVACFVNQRRRLQMRLRYKAEEIAAQERKEKMIVLRESGYVL
jgi:uncharacterized membrane protein